MLHHSLKHRAELKLSRYLPNIDHYRPFFFCSCEISEQASRQIATEEPNRDLYTAKHLNLRYYNVSRDENPQKENEWTVRVLKVFTPSLIDCKLAYGNKNQTQLTLI